MKKQYKIQLPKGKKVTMTNVDFENGVMTVNVELENKEEPISEAEKVIKHLRSIDWDKRTKESIDRIRDELYHKKHPETISNYERWESKFGDINEQKYEPKDGDFISFGTGLISIFKNTGKYWFNNYATLCGDCLTLFKEGWVGKNIRPATEEEKKLLIDKLAEVGKLWNKEKKCLEDVRWRAENGKVYYYIMYGDDDTVIASTYDMRIRQDERRYNIGNYFRTREAAEKAAEQIREIFKNSNPE